mmetsp:Transcript_4041/g.25382  ORF Transcript_4041/g.25382 Transcript_4041/m.25382 type:complete len:222 (+) Transcript_4041:1345-2010(+)
MANAELVKLLARAAGATKMCDSDFVIRCMTSRMRKCMLTERIYPSAWMVRFVLAVCPEGKYWAVPDVTERLPGRGAWIIPSAVALKAADELDKFSYVFKQKVSCIPDGVVQVEKKLQDHCAQLLAQGMVNSTAPEQDGEPVKCTWKIVPWTGDTCSPLYDRCKLVCDVLDSDNLKSLGHEATKETEVRISLPTSKQLQREVFRLKTLRSTLNPVKTHSTGR